MSAEGAAGKDEGGTELDAARRRVRDLAWKAVEERRPTSWFEALYREAAGDASKIPWADLVPHPALVAFLDRPGALEGVRTAAVVGCGLGHDAEHLASRGLSVVGFDVSPEAIAWAKRLHPGSKVRYEVADLLDLPSAFRCAFDLVVEIYTLQALPVALRERVSDAVVSLLRSPGARESKGGRLFLFTRVAPGTDPVPLDAGPPWPLTRAEVTRVTRGLTVDVPWVEVPDSVDPSIVRAHGVWVRTGTRS